MKVFYSLSNLISYANTLIEDKELVSLDLFDTLFIRRVHDPDLIKIPVARFIADHANKNGVRVNWYEVQKLRDEIESAHRARNGSVHPDHEANYDEFMEETLRRVFEEHYVPELFELVSGYEIKMEAAMLSPRPELVAWLKQLKQMGKKIVLASDIYLPAAYLERLVEANQLSSYVTAVVSSADTCRAKASGAGYALLQEKYGVDPSRWLHVGDNVISDGVRADEFGITALVIQDLKEKQRKGIVRLIHSLAGIKKVWKGRNVLQLMMPLEADNAEHSELYVDGYNLFGPILGYFVQCLAEQCQERGIRRVFFCSREGWMFFECWKRMIPYLFPDGSAPEASYLHVSRIGLSRAACANAGLTATNATAALLPAQNKDFVDICRVYGLEPEPLHTALERSGLSVDEEIVPVQADDAGTVDPENPFSILLDDEEFQQEVRNQGQASRDLVEEFLRGQGFFDHDDIALVDIGWLGTIQHYLHQAIMHCSDRPNIHGFLLAATRMVPYPSYTRNRYDGLVFDQHQFNLATSYILTVKDVFEEICRAPHPSVIGYQRVDGAVQAMHRSAEDEAAHQEKAQSDYYEPLHQGILDAVERYAAGVSVLGYSTSSIRPWLNFHVAVRLAFPHTREVTRIRHFFHHDDFAAKRKINKAVTRYYRSLWDIESWKIAFVPFIRLRYFYKHIGSIMWPWA